MPDQKLVCVPVEPDEVQAIAGEAAVARYKHCDLKGGFNAAIAIAAYKDMLAAAPPVDAVPVPRELLRRCFNNKSPIEAARAADELRALLGGG